MSNGNSRAFLLLGLLAALLLAGPQLLAQEPAPAAPAPADPAAEAADETKPEGDAIVEEIVVVGSRAEPRSATESMVPVDVITAADFQSQGDTDVSNLLRTLAPSFNVNTQPISDAATVVRPANLRGLAPDHTLVLINGKRRHRAAVIYWIGNGVANGAQGPDISVIPSIALRQVEVLRDGASAQYGSDAIAGVLNFQLKDASHGGSVEVRGGQFKEGDGTASSVAGNMGFGLGEDGFFNFSFEYGQSDPTDRSVQRDDAAALIAAGNTNVADPAQVWGSPEINDDLKLWANFGKLLSGGSQFYGHANYASKSVLGGFYFRNPNNRGGVFSGDDGETLLVGDLLDAQDGVLDHSAGCPTIHIVNNVPDPVALAAVRANPNCFTFYEAFPRRLHPEFRRRRRRRFAAARRLRGSLDSGLTWDFSVSGGSNEVSFSLVNSVNASLGPDSPVSFEPGSYTQEETGVNLDFGYPLGDRTHLAGGLEWRNERFEIGLGDNASWEVGPLAEQGFSAASNGFPGFGPIAAGAWDRANYAAYVDLEHTHRRRQGRVRRRGALRGFRRFRHHHQRQGVGPLRDHRQLHGARQRLDRLPGAHPGPVERLQRDHRLQRRNREAAEQRHHPVELPGRPAARRRAARARGVDQLRARLRLRAGCLPLHGRLLPDRPQGPHRHQQKLPADPGRRNRAAARRRHLGRRQHREVPLLRQRLRHHHRRHRRGLHLGAAGARRQNHLQPALQPHRNRGHRVQCRTRSTSCASASSRRRCRRPGGTSRSTTRCKRCGCSPASATSTTGSTAKTATTTPANTWSTSKPPTDSAKTSPSCSAART